MSNNNKTPAIRFKGFTDTWEQRKLGEISESFEYGLNAAATEYDGKHKYIRITDIDDSTHLFLQDNLTSPDVDFSTVDDYLLQKGDVLFARTGASVGKTYIYRPSDGDLYFAGFLIRAKIKSDYDADFIFQNTLTDNYDSYIRITSQRSGQPGVNAQEYANFALSVPCLAEQKKIGAYFTNLDNLITLHQRKYDKLIQFKAAMLKKMFPQNGANKPEMRFPEFTDTWEQRKLENITSLITKGTTPKDKSGNGEVNFIKVENIDPSSGIISSCSRIFLEEHEGYLKRSQLKENDILFSIAGTLGRTSVVNKGILPANTNQALAILRVSEGDISYLVTVLRGRAVSDFIKKNPTVGAQPNLSLEQVSNLEIPYPSIEEQQKIGGYFRNLDTLITLHQRKCDKYKSIKSGLIKKLFP